MSGGSASEMGGQPTSGRRSACLGSSGDEDVTLAAEGRPPVLGHPRRAAPL